MAQRPKLTWDWGAAFETACDRLKDATGTDVWAAIEAIESPVEKARVMAELFSPADMVLSLGLGLGTSREELEKHPRAVRLITELAHRRLSIVGLKSGETVQADMSDRMQEFLTRFFERAGAEAIETTATPVRSESADRLRALESAP